MHTYIHMYTHVHKHVWAGKGGKTKKNESDMLKKRVWHAKKTSLTCQKNESEIPKKTSLTSYDITYPTFLKTESLLPVPTSTLSSDIINPQNPKNESGIQKNESENFSEFFWGQTGYSNYSPSSLKRKQTPFGISSTLERLLYDLLEKINKG